MHTNEQTKARATCEKLAALADPTRNDNEAERAVAMQKLIQLCETYGFKLADFIKPAASPDTGEKPEQPEAPKAKAKAERKADTSSKQSDDKRNAERERARANATYTSAIYNGASQASHRSVAPKLAEAIERVANPIQRAKSATTRDESGIALAAKHANGQHDFDPIAATIDLGILSRLSSLGLITVSPVSGKIRITKAGRDLAANVAKRAA